MFGPALVKGEADIGAEVIEVGSDELSQWGQIEEGFANVAGIEEVGGDAIREAGFENSVDVFPFRVGSGGIPGVLVQSGDDSGVHVFGDHEFIAKVKRRRVDSPGQQFGRFIEVGAVV